MIKITREELRDGGSAASRTGPLDLFWQGIRAEETRKTYTRTLRRLLCGALEEVLEGTFEERAAQLVRLGKDDPDRTLDLVLRISGKIRARSSLPHDHPDYFNPSGVPNYFKPLKKLFDMNGVTMPWKRIYSTFPESDNVTESRGWTRGEIQSMLRFAKGSADRAVILVAASSGIRAGGFELLRWSDLRPIYRVAAGEGGSGEGDGSSSSDVLSFEHGGDGTTAEPVCAMLTVYARTNASYPAFVTPEAYAAVMDYRNVWAAEVGRSPEPGDPIFKRVGSLPAKATTPLIKRRIEKVADAAGLRASGRKSRNLFDVPIMNGFRRFWNKACKESSSRESPLSSLIRKEYMMGHVGLVSLDRNYFKTHVMELAEEYLQSVPHLTIDDAARLRLANARQSERIGLLEDEKDREIAKLRLMVEQLAGRIESYSSRGI
ncbi:MAG: integrase [Thaumarchaeota archaeon]|nr:integrase [Nitrososphaerota archaeon]MDE0525576.1 integrase [Nitrososphaerota archaeon]